VNDSSPSSFGYIHSGVKKIRMPYRIVFPQVVTHAATFDFWAVARHALRATPHGERPISAADYERTTGKRARDRQLELWERQGIELPGQRKVGEDPTKLRGYND